MRDPLDRGTRPQDPNLEAITSFYCGMLTGKTPNVRGLAFADILAPSRLDFSLASLQVVDSYLAHVRARLAAEESPISDTTALAIACYLGEVIRRGSPAGECQWVSDLHAGVSTDRVVLDMGTAASIALLTASSGITLSLVQEVTRSITGNGSTLLIYEYAIDALRRIWTSAVAAQR